MFSQNISFAYIRGLAKKGSVQGLFSIATFLNALRNTTQNQINFSQPFQRTCTNLSYNYAINLQSKIFYLPEVKIILRGFEINLKKH